MIWTSSSKPPIFTEYEIDIVKTPTNINEIKFLVKDRS
jgi:hypothetical protein